MYRMNCSWFLDNQYYEQDDLNRIFFFSLVNLLQYFIKADEASL